MENQNQFTETGDIVISSDNRMQIDGKYTELVSQTKIPSALIDALRPSEIHINADCESDSLTFKLDSQQQAIPMQISDQSQITLVSDDSLAMNVNGQVDVQPSADKPFFVQPVAGAPFQVSGTFKLQDDDKGAMSSFVSAVSTIQTAIETFKTAVSYEAGQSSAGLSLAISDIKTMGNEINRYADDLLTKLQQMRNIDQLYNSHILNISESVHQIGDTFDSTRASISEMTSKLNVTAENLVASNDKLTDHLTSIKSDIIASFARQEAHNATIDVSISDLNAKCESINDIHDQIVREHVEFNQARMQNAQKQFDLIMHYLKVGFFSLIAIIVLLITLKMLGVL